MESPAGARAEGTASEAAAEAEPRSPNGADPVADNDVRAPVAAPSERRPQVVLPEPERDNGPTYFRLGVDYTFGPEDEEIHFQCARIKKLENLESVGANLKRLILIANCVEKIENLETNINLEHLELYQNLVKRIDNIVHLTNLTTLDLSFNKIRKMDGFGAFDRLERLYLSSNKIEAVEHIFELRSLKMLELGSNRIRGIPPELGNLTELEELWLGKNKITSMALPPLPKLKHVSMQNNRLEVWDPVFFRHCPNVTHLYLGFNNLPDVPEDIQALESLQEIDLAKNAIERIRPLPGLLRLKDMWLNDNRVDDLDEVRNLASMPVLETVYLERNPMQGFGDAEAEARYKAAIIEAVPGLKQLDAVILGEKVRVITNGTEHQLRGIRKR